MTPKILADDATSAADVHLHLPMSTSYANDDEVACKRREATLELDSDIRSGRQDVHPRAIIFEQVKPQCFSAARALKDRFVELACINNLPLWSIGCSRAFNRLHQAAEIRQYLAKEQKHLYRCHDTTRDPEQWERRLFVMCEQKCLDSDGCIRRLQVLTAALQHTHAPCKPALSRSSTKGPNTPVQMSWGMSVLTAAFANAVERNRVITFMLKAHAMLCL